METLNSNMNQIEVKMKDIPRHCQQGYQTSLSQIPAVTTAPYNQRVESLLNNNMCLARALERCRYELAEKEYIALENTKNIDVISISGIKLRDLSNNLKKMTASVDETLAILESHTSTRTSQNFQFRSNVGRDLKNKISSVPRMEILDEVAEVVGKPRKSTKKCNFKKNPQPLLINNTAKNVKGKSVTKATTTCKSKSKKQCLKPKGKLPVTFKRATNIQANNETYPSYLLGISSELNNLVQENKDALNSKVVESKKPSKSKTQKHTKYTKNKAQEPKLSIKIKNGKIVNATMSNDKASKKSKVTSGKQVSSTKLQSLSTESMTSSSAFESQSSSSGVSIDQGNLVLQKPTYDKSSCLQSNCETNNSFEDVNVANSLNNAVIFTDLDCISSPSQPTVLLKNTDLSKNSVKKKTISIHNIEDGCSEESKKTVLLNNEATTSAVPKKKVQFQLNREDDIEMLSDSQDSLPKPTIKYNKPQKRPLKDNYQNFQSMPKRQALYTVGGELDKVKVNGENTYVVTAEIHSSPDDVIKKKLKAIKGINHPNMQPYVVLTDIFKSSLHNIPLGGYQSQLVPAEPKTTIVKKEIDESLEMPCSEDMPNDCYIAMCDKENKIDELNDLEERKPHRRTSSKVKSYKEMKLNVKMRRC